MGILNDFKKLFFGAKAVSKSAAEKGWEKSKQAAQKIEDKAEDLADKAKDKIEDVGEDVIQKGSAMWEKTMDSTEEFRTKFSEKSREVFEDAQDFAEDVGEKVIEKTEDLFRKGKSMAREFSSTESEVDEDEFVPAGNKSQEDDKLSDLDDLFDTGPESTESNVTTDAPEDIDDFQKAETQKDYPPADKVESSSLVKKAQEMSDKLSEKLDDTLDQAEKLAAKDEATYRPSQSHNEALGKSSMPGDDFFAKASAFADGDYNAFNEAPEIQNADEDQKDISSHSEPLPGFEDLDGDGNEIIDDALIVDEEE